MATANFVISPLKTINAKNAARNWVSILKTDQLCGLNVGYAGLVEVKETRNISTAKNAGPGPSAISRKAGMHTINDKDASAELAGAISTWLDENKRLYDDWDVWYAEPGHFLRLRYRPVFMIFPKFVARLDPNIDATEYVEGYGVNIEEKDTWLWAREPNFFSKLGAELLK